MTYYKINEPNVSAELIDNELLAVNILTGRYYSLKNTSAVFWCLLTEGYSLELAIDKVAEVYTIDQSIVKHDFLNFVTELTNSQLIVATNNPVIANQNTNWLNAVSGSYSQPVIEIHTDMESLVELGS